MAELLQDITFNDYPLQTCIHWGQGILVGHLVIRARVKDCVHLRGYAHLAFWLFVIYEGYEQLRIADRGDVDVLNFGLCVHLSAGITLLFYFFRNRRKKQSRQNRF